MTTPTNEPEETATPESDKAYRGAKLQDPSTGVHGQYWGTMQSLELRAILAERERDELREMLESILPSNRAHPCNPVRVEPAKIEEIRQILTRTKPAQ